MGWGPGLRKALEMGGRLSEAGEAASGRLCQHRYTGWGASGPRASEGGGGVHRVSLSSPRVGGRMAGAGFRNSEAGAATLYF